jgi:CRISPR-associated protein Cmr4
MTEFLLYLYAESPVHTGAADSLDTLSLPVQREAATGYPVIWGQSLKGALRQAARENPDFGGLVTAVFGSEPGENLGNGGTTPGLLAVGDAQLVAMPVPTLRRTFAWLTSEIAVARLARKYTALDRDGSGVPAVPKAGSDAALAATGWRTLVADGTWDDPPPRGEEVIGPYVVPLTPDAGVTAWAEKVAGDAFKDGNAFEPFAGKFKADLVLAGTDLVPNLLKECTEQAVRVQLETDKKTVKNGPFYSEYLPAETIMAASLTLRLPNGDQATAADRHARHREALRALLDGALLRIGGDETLGKGLMWGRLLEEGRQR